MTSSEYKIYIAGEWIVYENCFKVKRLEIWTVKMVKLARLLNNDSSMDFIIIVSNNNNVYTIFAWKGNYKNKKKTWIISDDE